MATYRTIISSKGQVVIPAELREEFGLKKGTPATWTGKQGHLVLTPITESLLDEMQGFLEPRPGEPSLFELSLEEREHERQRERAK